MLVKTEQFSRLWPSLATVALYACSFYFLSQALKDVPVGVAYALWSGVGTALIAIVGFAVFRQTLDAAAVLGIGLIVAGVVVMNLFSGTAVR